MIDFPLLQDIVIILGISVIAILLFQRVKLPSILGLLLTGVITGPHGFSLIKASHEVELLSEIGVIFLLFVIGIEFSLKSLASIKRTVFLGGFLQVSLTIAITALFVFYMGYPVNESIFVGFLVSLSSTAIVLKILHERRLIQSPQGQVTVALLIFQDIVVVPMMLVTPLMAGYIDNIGSTVALLIVKIVGTIIIVILLSRYVMPYILKRVVRTRNKELFILTIVLACFATAWLTSAVGLSLALGAFFAGLIISESDYSHQATANILPFREIFISFFFVSIGMLLDVGFLLNNLGYILLLVLIVGFVKIIVTGFSVFILRYQQRVVINTALNLFQVGEFSFLLAGIGLSYHLLSTDVYQYFLSVSVLSMAITPFIMIWSPKLVTLIVQIPLPPSVRNRLNAIKYIRTHKQDGVHELTDHIIIIGYGINGSNVTRAARFAGIPHVVIEMNPDIVETLQKEGVPVVYGDGSSDVLLSHVNVVGARVVVIAISDPEATKNIVAAVRQFSELVHIIVRTRYIDEISDNINLGADEVIPEEFETSIEIFTSVLRNYLVPRSDIADFAECILSPNYELFCENWT